MFYEEALSGNAETLLLLAKVGGFSDVSFIYI